MYIIGIDPGGHGGFYVLFKPPTSNQWIPGNSLVMPMVDIGKRVRDVNIPEVVHWIRAQEEYYEEKTKLIKVMGMPFCLAGTTSCWV
jgi:hypothetical protein